MKITLFAEEQIDHGYDKRSHHSQIEREGKKMRFLLNLYRYRFQRIYNADMIKMF